MTDIAVQHKMDDGETIDAMVSGMTFKTIVDCRIAWELFITYELCVCKKGMLLHLVIAIMQRASVIAGQSRGRSCCCRHNIEAMRVNLRAAGFNLPKNMLADDSASSCSAIVDLGA